VVVQPVALLTSTLPLMPGSSRGTFLRSFKPVWLAVSLLLLGILASRARLIIGPEPVIEFGPDAELLPMTVNPAHYPWLSEVARRPSAPLWTRFRVPPGWNRVEPERGSFGAWLQGLPVLTDTSAVHDYRGQSIFAASAAVAELDLIGEDLQQCADSILRLYAEFSWVTGAAGALKFHFTSGDVTTWKNWQRGERHIVAGDLVLPVPWFSPGRSRSAFRSWLTLVFRYAGTRSMALDSSAVPPTASLKAGDFFVLPGSPGHTVLILDVIEHAASGERRALVGQGYTPAQEFHVIATKKELALEGVWFRLPQVGESLTTYDSSPFPRETARKFNGQ